MLSAEIIIKRLSIIKALFTQALQQSYHVDAISFFSILSFHDSVEMFLKLTAEHKGIKAEGSRFLDYWDKIPNLTLLEPMRILNTRRVNLKHKGLIPAIIEVESSRVATSDFLSQNCTIQLGIDFNTISMSELITDPKVRTLLVQCEKYLESSDYQGCIKNVAIAFFELLSRYKGGRTPSGYPSPFEFVEKTEYRFHYGAEH